MEQTRQYHRGNFLSFTTANTRDMVAREKLSAAVSCIYLMISWLGIFYLLLLFYVVRKAQGSYELTKSFQLSLLSNVCFMFIAFFFFKYPKTTIPVLLVIFDKGHRVAKLSLRVKIYQLAILASGKRNLL